MSFFNERSTLLAILRDLAYTGCMASWRDVTSLYQIYPRSFQDFNGDGVGDLNGITSRLDYMRFLGIDAIWLSPFFTSPMTDLGYDVADYCAVDPLFGTLDDFRLLLDQAHERDIKVMIDLVACHTSDQHPWFQAARSGRDNPYRDWYVWRDPQSDGAEPNNWRSISGGSSWQFDQQTGQYYLHSFLPSQPDLNWDNPAVRQAIKEVGRFWFNLGVDGIRVDAIWGISKDPYYGNDSPNSQFDGDPTAYGAYIHNHCKHGPHFTEYLHELASICDEYDDRQMVYEFYPDEQLGDIWQQYGTVLHAHPNASAFFMEYRQNEWHAEHVAQKISRYAELSQDTTAFFCLGNHDQPRIASRLGEPRARALAFLNLCMPGISVVYYGDEIGMEDSPLTNTFLQKAHLPHGQLPDSRLSARTPMQWTSGKFAGFASVPPWLPIHRNRHTINVLTEAKDLSSLLHMHRQLLHLRRASPLLRDGTLEPFPTYNGFVVAFRRRYQQQQAVVAVNFADSPQTVSLPADATTLLAATSHTVQYDSGTLVLPGYGGALVGST